MANREVQSLCELLEMAMMTARSSAGLSQDQRPPGYLQSFSRREVSIALLKGSSLAEASHVLDARLTSSLAELVCYAGSPSM
jgi:hypothetical protein